MSRIEPSLARLYLYAFSLCREEEMARDLVQQCALRALSARKVPRDEPAYRAWLFTILRNTLIDETRRRGTVEDFARAVAYFVDIASEYGSDFVVFPELFTIQLLSQLLDRPFGALRLDEGDKPFGLGYGALDQLPARYGDILEWKYVEGHSVKDIAQRLGIRQPQVSKHLGVLHVEDLFDQRPVGFLPGRKERQVSLRRDLHLAEPVRRVEPLAGDDAVSDGVQPRPDGDLLCRAGDALVEEVRVLGRRLPE